MICKTRLMPKYSMTKKKDRLNTPTKLTITFETTILFQLFFPLVSSFLST